MSEVEKVLKFSSDLQASAEEARFHGSVDLAQYYMTWANVILQEEILKNIDGLSTELISCLRASGNSNVLCVEVQQ